MENNKIEIKLENIRSKYVLKLVFMNLSSKTLLQTIKYNKEIQNRLEIDINNYKDYSEIYSKIEIEITPARNKYGNFINIPENQKSFYHIYFNEDENEIKRNYLKENENILKIKLILDYKASVQGLFKDCKCIESLNFIKFYRTNISNMSFLFSGCSSLKKINFINFKTDNVTNMFCMFSRCVLLKELDLSKFVTKNVKDMSYMFYDCSALVKLNTSNFDINNVIDTSFMFYKCFSLKELHLSNLKPNNKLKYISYMFYGCSSLENLDISNINLDKKTNMDNTFYGCSKKLKMKLETQFKNIII